MDDDAVNRREAISGLSVLGALMLSLVGVIVYRIVVAGPTKPRLLREAIVVADPSAGADDFASAAADLAAPSDAPSASPIGVTVESEPVAGAFPLASAEEPAPREPPSVGSGQAARGTSAHPIFVSPGSGVSRSPR